MLKYVCLSDLHFGSPGALMTDTPASDGADEWNATSLRDAFSSALMATLDAYDDVPRPADKPAFGHSQPGVILLGDIFDLSLGTPSSSVNAFESFLNSIAAVGGREKFSSFTFLPGNHDHDLWTATRFQEMVGASQNEDRYQHTTRAFAPPAEGPLAALLDPILRRNYFVGATTFYPNMGLVSDDGKRTVVLHHGHFVEPMYRAMSTLVEELSGGSEIAMDAESLERLNASWIDFFWSTDGDNGLLGAAVRGAHRALYTGTEDIRFTHKLADVLAKKLADNLPIPHTPTGRQWALTASKAFVDSTLGQSSQLERLSFFETLSQENVAGLKSYLGETVRQQMEAECPNQIYSDVTFIFGHTHKPFETAVLASGFSKPVSVYNTGGWDLDMPMFGTKLGAAIVFIDTDLNVASLRVCDVPEGGDADLNGCGTNMVRVETVGGSNAENDLSKALKQALEYKSDTIDVPALWRNFHIEAIKGYRAKQVFIMNNPGQANDLLDETGAS